MIWIATRYRHNYYYFDEWSMIDDTRGSWFDMFGGFQGHLEVFSFIIYRVQRSWFGLEGHQLVYLAFMVSLAALQLSVAAVLRRLGLSTVLALLSATVAVYLGPGAQGMSWQFMLGINLALAFSFVAGYFALGEAKTPKTAMLITGLLLLAFAADSGVAVFGAVFAGLIVVLLWPLTLTLRVLALPAIAHVAWLLFGQAQIGETTSFDTTFTFANRLFLYSLAGLVGGGEVQPELGGPGNPTIPINAAVLGLIVFVVTGLVIAAGIVRHRLTRAHVVTLIAGMVAAVVSVLLIAWKRAFLIPPTNIIGSRYVQWIAVLLVVALAPAIAATLRARSQQTNRIIVVAVAIALAGVFVVNLDTLRPARRFNEEWSQASKAEVARAVAVLSNGCGKGSDPALHAKPSPGLNPAITVELLQDLLADEALTPKFGIPPLPETRDIVCRPDTAKQ